MFDFWTSLIKDIWIWIRGGSTFHIDEWGIRRWFYCGKSHCELGPAVEYPDGTKFWYSHGRLHRIGGPAVEWPSGGREWYLDNQKLSLEEYIVKLEELGLKDKVLDSLFYLR